MPSLDEVLATMGRTDPAAESATLPPGRYTADLVMGELFTANNGSAGYKSTFRITDGEYAGRRTWLTNWLTGNAMSYTVRDPTKLFGRRPLEAELRGPAPAGVRCHVTTVLRNGYSEVRHFDVVSRDVEPAPYTPGAE